MDADLFVRRGIVLACFKGQVLSTCIYCRHFGLFGVCIVPVFAKDGVLDRFNKHDAENIAQTMESDKPWIEETREFFGLVILIAVLFVNYIHAKRKTITKKQLS